MAASRDCRPQFLPCDLCPPLASFLLMLHRPWTWWLLVVMWGSRQGQKEDLLRSARLGPCLCLYFTHSVSPPICPQCLSFPIHTPGPWQPS